jgi:hypothetical protein
MEHGDAAGEPDGPGAVPGRLRCVFPHNHIGLILTAALRDRHGAVTAPRPRAAAPCPRPEARRPRVCRAASSRPD